MPVGILFEMQQTIGRLTNAVEPLTATQKDQAPQLDKISLQITWAAGVVSTLLFLLGVLLALLRWWPIMPPPPPAG